MINKKQVEQALKKAAKSASSASRRARSTGQLLSIPTPPEPAWGHDELTSYLEAAYKNRLVTFNKLQAQSFLLSDIDQCFVDVSKDWITPNLLVPFLFSRSHSAFRVACEHAMGGQLSETFSACRLSLEAAAYGLHIHKNPAAGETWLRRHDGGVGPKKTSNEFKIATVRCSIEVESRDAAKRFKALYQDAIDSGAHPNERSVSQNTKFVRNGEERRLEICYLSANPLMIASSLRFVAQCGVCSLEILEFATRARFELLGVGEKLRELRTGL